MKRPGLKKPSAAPSIQATISKLSRGVSKSDLVTNKKDKDAEETEPETTGRDKAKGQKYLKLKDSLPDHIVDLVEKQSLKAASPREFKTMAINKLFVKNKQGRLELNTTDQLFEEHKKIYTKRYSTERENALPESILKGLYFHNDDQAFQRALKKGDIMEVDCGDGKSMFAFQSYEKGREDATEEAQTLKGNSKISKEQSKILAKAFQAVSWNWRYKDQDCERFLPGATIPASIATLIKEATESQTKLAKEAGLIIKQWTGDKTDQRFGKLKKGHGVCTQNIARLNHMKEFHELPDDLEPTKENLDKVMLDMATHTSEYNELIEVTRGVLKAKNK